MTHTAKTASKLLQPNEGIMIFI